MIKIIYLLIIILIFFILYLISYECMADNKNFTYLNRISALLTKNKVFSSDNKIELTKLPTVSRNMKVDYYVNKNQIIKIEALLKLI